MEILLPGLLLAVILAVFIIWPRSGLYSLAFFLPVIGWLFYFGSLIIPLIDLLAGLALAAFFLSQAWTAIFRTQSWQPPKWPLLFPVGIFLLISGLSALTANNPASSLWYVARWPLFMYLAYVFLPYNLIDSPKVLKRTMAAVVLGAAVVLISGYLSLYGQDWLNSFYRIRSILWFGIYPFGENHNLIAEFLNVGALLILTLRFLAKEIRVRRLLDIGFILMLLGIFLTFSRAGWISLALQAAIFIGYLISARKVRPSGIVLGAVFTLVILTPLVWRMTQLQRYNVSSTENRWLLTEISWQAFQDRPYLGHGSGEFTNLVDKNIRFIAKYGEATDSHGMLQKVLAENGIFGLAAWLFLLTYLTKVFVQATRKYWPSRHWLLPLFLAGAGGLFFQLFNTSYYKGKVWLPVALGLAAVRLLDEKQLEKYERKD